MNFDRHGTLAGYARTSVNLRARMVDYHRTRLSQDHVTTFLSTPRPPKHQPQSQHKNSSPRCIT